MVFKILFLALGLFSVIFVVRSQNDIIDVLRDFQEFRTLIQLIQEVNLTDTLRGKGPFTVFAPVDKAFAELPEEAWKSFKDINLLRKVMSFHVVPGSIMSSELRNEVLLRSAEGQNIRINVYQNATGGNVLTADGCPITRTDAKASNGVIHVMSEVMFPLPGPSITETLSHMQNLSFLLTALQKADLAGTLSGDDTYTFFAPTNEAFDQLPPAYLEMLLTTKMALSDLLEFHMFYDVSFRPAFYDGLQIRSLQGPFLTFSVKGPLGPNTSIGGGASLFTSSYQPRAYRKVEQITSPAPLTVPRTQAELVTLYDCFTLTMKFLFILFPLLCVVSAREDHHDVIDVMRNLQLRSLVQLLEVADLTPSLEDADSCTVFAPSDAAFAKIPDGIKKQLLSNPLFLREVLAFHASPKEYMSTDLKNNQLLDTLLKGFVMRINIYPSTNTITADGSPVSNADNKGSNGVVHVVDQVLYPFPTGTVDSEISHNDNLTVLNTAVEKADLANALDGEGPFTLFAPTNDAFSKLPNGTLPSLLKNVTALTEVLTYHVVSGVYYPAGLSDGEKLTTLQKGSLVCHVNAKPGSDPQLMVNNANFVGLPLPSINGVVQMIDTVLIPPK
ncbi:transforming growth factor-beta-induced protein ig-h3-like [Branchiostoma floridae x Branchiostoma belcheri]